VTIRKPKSKFPLSEMSTSESKNVTVRR
jgi:hypothetical protein